MTEVPEIGMEEGGERAGRMARRLEWELERAGLDAPDRRRVLDAHHLAMEPRVESLDDHDPAFLHPGRTVIVLLTDVGPLPARALAAAALVESEDEPLRVPAGEIEELLGGEVAAGVGEVPLPGDPRLVEKLVTVEGPLRLVALAERLDQLRHAHLWDDPRRLRRAHREATEVYLPVAVRAHPRLERRYRWWCEKFEGR